MRPVCSHDLPNQAVALQSLLQLFAWDEAAQLSPQGREYFERLQSIANKTFALSQHLKELARLARYEPRSERLTFAVVADDVRAETQRADPECRWTWQRRWGHDSFRGSPPGAAARATPASGPPRRAAPRCRPWTCRARLRGSLRRLDDRRGRGGRAPAVWPRADDANEQQLALTLGARVSCRHRHRLRAAGGAPGVVAFTSSSRTVIANRPHD